MHKKKSKVKNKAPIAKKAVIKKIAVKNVVVNDIKRLSQDTKLLLTAPEGREVDFKVKPEGVKADDIIAFANTQGGIILVGVDEINDPAGKQIGGKVVGCNISDQTKMGFINTAASCRPSIDIGITIENTATATPIYRITIPEGKDKPYGTSSGTYKIRADGQNIAIDPTMMTAIILEKETEEFIARFSSAADALLAEINHVHHSLEQQILRVELAVESAEAAAHEATAAAEDAARWTQA